MKKIVLNIEGMTCSACSNGLEKYLNRQNGIKEASVNLVLATALIEYDETKINRADLDRFVKEAGFKSAGENNAKRETKNGTKKLIFFVILAVVQMYIAMGHMADLPIPSIISMKYNPVNYGLILMFISVIFLFYGLDIIDNGLKNIIHRMPNMDSLVGIGVVVNFFYSVYNLILVMNGNTMAVHNLYFEASSMIILFVKIGRTIDKNSKTKAVETIKNLVTITPKYGTILKDGNLQKVTINEIKKGNTVVCKPGEKIAVDGTIIKGSTHTDESFITGESKPVSKNIGDKVIAGSINYDGYIEYTAEKIGKNSSISGIVDMVVEATNTKAPIARLADKISGYFVPTIFAIALISFVINYVVFKDISKSINSFVSVLVVACPCALGLSTPLAMVVSIGKCSKKGILIKSSESIEVINKIDTVVFDKTGTLTYGKLKITDREITDENLKILQRLEANSNHPIAKAICENNKIKPADNLQEIAGYGISGEIDGKKYYAGNGKFLIKINNKMQNRFYNSELKYLRNGETVVYLFTEEQTLGIIGLSDKVRDDINDVINKLKSINKTVIMLTGDNEKVAEKIGKQVGISEIYSNVTPAEKLEKIKEINKNKNCIMIGDGINDSPALKTSAIGISVNGGSDISQDSADIILLNDNMNNIYDLFNIGRKTMKIVKQNLFWALFYNICMIPLATGVLPISINPMISSLAMTFSSLTVVLNSLCLLK